MADTSTAPSGFARTGVVRGSGADRVLYHYSALVLLAPTLRGWLSEGDGTDPHFFRQGVRLTPQTDQAALRSWRSHARRQARAVRYTCRIPVEDGRLEPARRAWRRIGVPPSLIRRLDPCGQSDSWYHYRGVIPPAWLSVELRGRRGYVPVSGPDLVRVAAAAAAAWKTVTVFSMPAEPFISNFWDSPDTDLGLFAEEYPADRFGLSRD
jgi:hypothetical protein